MPITQVQRKNRMGSVDWTYANRPPHESTQELTKETRKSAIPKTLSTWQKIKAFWNSI